MPTPAATPRLSRELIVAEALRAIDRDGLDALSMRALAERVGTRPMSLYRHVADKDDLLAAVVGAMLGEIPPAPAGADWRRGLRAWAVGFRAVALRHPNAVPLLARRPVTGYAAGRDAAEAGLAMLEAAGFDADAAGLALRCVARYVVGFSLAGTTPAPDAAPKMLEGLREGGHPRLARMAARAGADRGDELFALGLDALLEGLSLRLGAGADSLAAGGRPAGGPGRATSAGSERG